MGRINDYTERTTITGSEELVGVEGVDTFKFTPETQRQYNNSQILTGVIEKTLAPTGGDFSTVQEVFDWLTATQFNQATISITITPATYSIGSNTRYEVPNGVFDLAFYNDWGNARTDVVFEIDNQDASGRTFNVQNVPFIRFINFSIINVGADLTPTLINAEFGRTEIKGCDVTGFRTVASVHGAGATLALLNNCGITSAAGGSSGTIISLWEGVQCFMTGGFIDNLSNTQGSAFRLADSCQLEFYSGTTISNCNQVFNWGGGASRVLAANLLTLVNNVTDYPFTVNKVQGDGSYITDGNLITGWLISNDTDAQYAQGEGALSSITSGTANIAIGKDAGDSLTTGGQNTLIGQNAGHAAPVDSLRGIAIGHYAGNSFMGTQSVNIGYVSSTDYNAVAVGTSAGAGQWGVSIGHTAGNHAYDRAINIGYLTAGQSYSTAIGYQAKSDPYAIAIGYNAKAEVDSIAIGANALDSTTTGAERNIAIGRNAGTAITTGDDNIAIGVDALKLSTTSIRNIAIGYQTLDAQTGTGGSNIAMGAYALSSAVNDARNIAIGEQALINMNGYDDVIAIGDHGGQGNAGHENISMGTRAGNWRTNSNVAIGHEAQVYIGGGLAGSVAIGAETRTGRGRGTVVGYQAGLGLLNTTGYGNSLYGYKAGDNLTTSSFSIIVGHEVDGLSATDDHQIVLGDAIVGHMSASTDVDYSAKSLTLTGTSAFATAATNLDAGDLILQGGTAAATGIGIGGDLILQGGAGGATGTQGEITLNATNWVTDTTNSNYGIGLNALNSITLGSGKDNIAIGENAGTATTTGDFNTYLGNDAGASASTSSYSVAIGYEAQKGYSNNQGSVAIGGKAGINGMGSYSIAIGYQAADSSTPDNSILIGRATEAWGDDSVTIGHSATGSRDGVYLGAFTGTGNAGFSNTFLGYYAAKGSTTVQRSIALGHEVAFTSATDDNQIAIGLGDAQTPSILGYMGATLLDTDMSDKALTITGPSALAAAVTNLDAGDLILQGGLAATTGIGIGGDLILQGGAGGDTGTDGQITLNATNWVTDTTNGNYAIGLNALDALISGQDRNIAIGTNAGTGLNQVAADDNVFIGHNAGKTESGGQGNVFLGSYAGENQLSKNYSTYIGYAAGRGGTGGGSSNVAVGYEAMVGVGSNGQLNTAIGRRALASVGVGDGNTAIGYLAGEDVTGDNNTMLGRDSGKQIISGDSNITIGFSSGDNITTGSYNITVGSVDALVATQSDQIVIGNGQVNPISGYMGARSDADYSAKVLTITGTSAFATAATNLDAGDLIIQGGTAATTGIGIGGDLILRGGAGGDTGTDGLITLNATNWVTDTTNSNYGIGLNALNSVTVGSGLRNIAIGENAGTALTTGDDNIFIGDDTGLLQSTTIDNIAIGSYALDGNGVAEHNIAIGWEAMSGPSYSNADYNVFIGYQAGRTALTAKNNVAIGRQALDVSNVGDGNVAIGYNAGGLAGNGDNNVFLGSNAGGGVTNGGGNICIGYNSTFASNRDEYINIGFGESGGQKAFVYGSLGSGTLNTDVSADNITITGTSPRLDSASNLDAGDLILQGGTAATTGIGIGGDVFLRGGAPGSTGTAGKAGLQDGADNTKQALFDMSGITTATTRTITVPDKDVDLGNTWNVSDDATLNYGHGLNALNAITATGYRNVALGASAGVLLSSADDNTFIGWSSGAGTTGASQQTCIGSGAGGGSGGAGNTAVGYKAWRVGSGNNNTIIGAETANNASGASNTVIGKGSGAGLTSGTNNLLIAAWNAGNNLTTGDYNLVIASGGASQVPVTTDDDQIRITNSSIRDFVAGHMSARSDIDYSAKNITITGTSAVSTATTNLDAGDLILQGGLAATTGIGIGGDLILQGGAGGTTGTKGNVNIQSATTDKIGFFGATPVVQQTALTAEDASTVDGTYGTEESDVINNLRTRVGELETILQNLGLLA